jgi:4-amino-4-deoxy-L-arabinose transferase-like glycosyltransferase
VVWVGLCTLLAILPYKAIKSMGDFFSPDRNFKSLTPALVESLRKPSLVFGILILFLGIFAFFWSVKTRDLVERSLFFLIKFYFRFIEDSKNFFRDVWQNRPSRLETLLLAVIVIFSAIARWMLINRPIEYDEAYTFVEFARHPFRYIVSTYYVPNNQVFNSLLMRISYLLFGDQLWQLRLPTYIASLLMVVCVFLLGRSLYNSKVGMAAAGIVAFLPTMILRSVSARGYIIVTLMALLGLLAANYLIRKKNIFVWLFLIFACAMGFYAIPVMLYPCGLVFVWLLLAWLTKEVSTEYPHFVVWLKYLVIAGFLILVLTILFYSPILLTNNLAEIYTNNRVLQPASLMSFFHSFPATFHGLLMDWHSGLSDLIGYVLLAGLVLSLLFHKRDSKFRLPMQFVFITYISLMLLVERPYPISRIWLWVIPLLAIWCAAGIVGVVEWGTRRWPTGFISPVLLGIMLFGFAANGMFQSYDMSVLHPTGEDPAAAKVTLFLKSQLTTEDYVAVSTCSDARYWYYFQFFGIPDNVLRNRNRFFAKVYIIVYTQANPSCGNEDMLKVFSEDGPDAVFFDLNTLRIVKQIDYATIYELDPIPERIQEAYPIH